MRTAKCLARLRGCTGSPEPLLVAYVISTIISWAGAQSWLERVQSWLERVREGAFITELGREFHISTTQWLNALALDAISIWLISGIYLLCMGKMPLWRIYFHKLWRSIPESWKASFMSALSRRYSNVGNPRAFNRPGYLRRLIDFTSLMDLLWTFSILIWSFLIGMPKHM